MATIPDFLAFPISSLTEFPKALVTNFDSEASPLDSAGCSNQGDRLFDSMFQYSDMLRAYLYLQDEVLPEVSAKGGIQSLITNDWRKYFFGVHKRIARHLLSLQQSESGRLTSEAVFSWHAGMSIQFLFGTWLMPKFREDLTKFIEGPVPADEDGFCGVVSSKYSAHSKAEIQAFINVVREVQLKDIPLTEAQRKELTKEKEVIHEWMTLLMKLQTAYYSEGVLTPEQKSALDAIVKIRLPAEQIPAAFDAMLERLQKNINAMDIRSASSISTHLADILYDAINIHGFGNANKRTTMAIVNLILRLIKQPAIMLRFSGESDDPTCLYSQAMSAFETDRVPLAMLIEQRLTEEPAREDLLKTREVMAQMKLLNNMKQLDKEVGKPVDLDLATGIIGMFVPGSIMAMADEREQRVLYLEFANNFLVTRKAAFLEKLQVLLKFTGASKSMLVGAEPDGTVRYDEIPSGVAADGGVGALGGGGSSVGTASHLRPPATGLTKDQKAECKRCLAILSDTVEGWKSYGKSDDILLISTVEQDIISAQHTLDAVVGDCCSLEKMRVKKASGETEVTQHVLKVSNIQLRQLVEKARKITESKMPEGEYPISPAA